MRTLYPLQDVYDCVKCMSQAPYFVSSEQRTPFCDAHSCHHSFAFLAMFCSWFAQCWTHDHGVESLRPLPWKKQFIQSFQPYTCTLAAKPTLVFVGFVVAHQSDVNFAQKLELSGLVTKNTSKILHNRSTNIESGIEVATCALWRAMYLYCSIVP